MTKLNTTFTYQTIASDTYKRVYFDHQQLLVMKRWLREEGGTFVEGQDSLYCLSSKFKYINKDVCQTWTSLKGETFLMTPGEIARTELERAFGRVIDVPDKHRLDLLDVKAPRYWNGIVYDPAFLYYTDLTGAYWQIWRLLTMDCVWPRGMGKLSMLELGERLKNNKPARNAVAGISMAHRVHMFYQGEFSDKAFYNPWFNPAVWAHLQAAVHQVACVAIEYGAVYIATDGYIFTDCFKWLAFNSWLMDHLLEFKTLNGEGYVTAWGSWKVGEKKTKKKRVASVLDHRNIVQSEGMIEWMKKRKTTLLGL